MTELKVFKPKANKYFNLDEEGILFNVGGKTLCLFREEVIEMLMEKFNELPDDRKTDPSLETETKYLLYGPPSVEAI